MSVEVLCLIDLVFYILHSYASIEHCHQSTEVLYVPDGVSTQQTVKAPSDYHDRIISPRAVSPLPVFDGYRAIDLLTAGYL